MRKIGLTRKCFFGMIAWTSLALMSGCYKPVNENFAEEEIIIENTAIGIQEGDDALEVAYYAEIIQKTANGGRKTADCGNIIYDQVNKTIAIDFGNVGCLGLFNRIRQGKIIVTYTTTLADSLSDRSLTFENYLVNGHKVSGTVSLHDISFQDTLLVATRTLTDLSVDFANGISITFNGSHTRTWNSGKGDTLLNNNVYSLQGSLTGVTSSGRTFQQDITTPITVNFYCAFLADFPCTSGVVELSKLKGYPDRKRTVDYGLGTCDKNFSVETFRRTYGAGVN